MSDNVDTLVFATIILVVGFLLYHFLCLLLERNCKDGFHKYEARYDDRPRRGDISGEGLTTEALRYALTYRVYVCDVCVRCGSVVYRKSKEEPS